MMCRGKRAGNLVITASAAGGRCAADLACSQLVEQQNEDALSGTPQFFFFFLHFS
jgi:L-ascorbate peroxidase